MNDTYCPKCGAALIKDYGGGVHKMRTAITIFSGNKASGKCKNCGTMIDLPISLEKADGVGATTRSLRTLLLVDAANCDRRLRKGET